MFEISEKCYVLLPALKNILCPFEEISNPPSKENKKKLISSWHILEIYVLLYLIPSPILTGRLTRIFLKHSACTYLGKHVKSHHTTTYFSQINTEFKSGRYSNSPVQFNSKCNLIPPAAGQLSSNIDPWPHSLTSAQDSWPQSSSFLCALLEASQVRFYF